VKNEGNYKFYSKRLFITMAKNISNNFFDPTFGFWSSPVVSLTSPGNQLPSIKKQKLHENFCFNN